MKKLIVMLTLAVSVSTYAQIGKGKMMLGVSFNYSNSKDTRHDSLSIYQRQYNYSRFTGSLRYGYFITDHIMIGAYGEVFSLKDNSSGNSPYTSYGSENINMYVGGVFSRYYKMIGKSKFAVFGELSAGYGQGTGIQKSTVFNAVPPPDTKTSQTSVGVGFIPGVTYFITPHLAVETSFGKISYNRLDQKTYNPGNVINEVVSSSFQSDLNLSFSSLFIGVNFYFGGKKAEALKPVN